MQPVLPPYYITTIILCGSLVGLLVIIAILRMTIRRQKERTQLASLPGDARTRLPEPWQKLRDEVAQANCTLSRDAFFLARKVFLDHYTNDRQDLSALTREYEREEFLLVLDEIGRPVRPGPGVLDSYHSTVRQHPLFERWFREEVLMEGEWAGSRVLLAARWLCHLVGLRHGTVEIFLDPPGTQGQTLVQVRSMDKFESPGAFDIPCAGHITGIDGVEQSLWKELHEELNLSAQDLDDFRLIGRYNAFGEPGASGINQEHRVLYRARLKPEASARIRFSDGEVAGLTVFSVTELRELVKKYPERVASGLSDAIGMYE